MCASLEVTPIFFAIDAADVGKQVVVAELLASFESYHDDVGSAGARSKSLEGSGRRRVGYHRFDALL